MSVSVSAQDKIELLSVDLLDQHRPAAESLKRLSKRLGIGLGWHYLLDLCWILGELPGVKGRRVVDAGAGTGLLQWYLAGQGAEVISVDRTDRAALSLRFRGICRVEGILPHDLETAGWVLRRNIKYAKGAKAKVLAGIRGAAGMVQIYRPAPGRGKVLIYHADLQSLSMVADRSVDAVVAVSALEHNSPRNLRDAVRELMRVLKPGGKLIATLCAACEKDWFHEPSQGWCYTEASLRDLFALDAGAPSNYSRYDQFFEDLNGCAELRDNLADFYTRSGNNGMPWGRWDPKYQPVGVVKVKK